MIAGGASRVGIGGPVGSGKTRLIERLLPSLHEAGLRVAVITNDLVTTEDADRVRRSGLIDSALVLGVETGACPHTAIREDPSANLDAAARLEQVHGPLDLIVIESGGDNLAATFTNELVDWWAYVIDTAAGDDIPRKGGIGLLRAINLVDDVAGLGDWIRDWCFDHGMILRNNGNILVFAPALIITAEQIDWVVDRIDQALSEAARHFGL